MGSVTYTAMASLDGFINDAAGRFDFAHPDAEVHAFVNELERPVRTYLYGRRLYETMAGWETMPTEGVTPEVRDYAELWRAADKVVYSTTLASVTTIRTRLERAFDPHAVRALKDATAHELSVGGAGLAAAALRAGLVDEVRLFLVPAIVGGGTRALPDGVVRALELLDERRFAAGAVYLRYAVSGAARPGRA
jgi:dihydrofolate reductase